MLRNVHIWIPSYIKQLLLSSPRSRRAEGSHIIFSFVDHFEPLWSGANEEIGRLRILRWIESYESEAESYRDCDCRVPRHTYFFPLDEYRAEFLEPLAEHCKKGYGEVEFHLHHDKDTAENLERLIDRFKGIFSEAGLLGTDSRRAKRYGFIHGNWALDDSGPGGRWCGVKNEITVLGRTGCYADFTMPSAPSSTQTSTINSIYYAIDDESRPKSHDRGIGLRVGGGEPTSGNFLMMVQGPLMLDWRRRRFGVLPRIENSEISGSNPPSTSRWRLWIDSSISLEGRPEWIFIKVFTHGCSDDNYAALFEKGGFRDLHSSLSSLGGEYRYFYYHYVTAREMYNIIKAAEAKETGNPYDFRDYIVKPPEYDSC